jgi:hypothetical protein
MTRLVILNYEDYDYDDYGSVSGMQSGIDFFSWGTYTLVIKHLSNIKTMEGDYVFVF